MEGFFHDDDGRPIDTLPVAIKARSLIAASLASQPELQKKISSIPESSASLSESCSCSRM